MLVLLLVSPQLLEEVGLSRVVRLVGDVGLKGDGSRQLVGDFELEGLDILLVCSGAFGSKGLELGPEVRVGLVGREEDVEVPAGLLGQVDSLVLRVQRTEAVFYR